MFSGVAVFHIESLARERIFLATRDHRVAHTKYTYLSSLSHRLASRRGTKKALIAVAHALLKIIYYLLSRQVSYQDLGANYFDERERQALEHRLVRRLQHLGYGVSLSPVSQSA
jgi:transposase